MFSNIEDGHSVKDFCMVGALDGKFYVGQRHDLEGLRPATREQRDLLFAKMEKAGYEWDADKLELRFVPKFKVGDKPQPTTKEELRKLIEERIERDGVNADLNDIDVSQITDMSELFDYSEFNGDISGWDVSNVENMERMFCGSDFNGDISKWDVSKVEDMRYMFYNSWFNGDISKWDVSNVRDMEGMFWESPFNGDISGWSVSKVTNMKCMFGISPLENNPPKWYKK